MKKPNIETCIVRVYHGNQTIKKILVRDGVPGCAFPHPDASRLSATGNQPSALNFALRISCLPPACR